MRRTLTTSRQWTASWAQEEGANPRRPEWLPEEDLQVYIDAFERTGFTGGLNWYRNMDRNWELSEPWAERRVEQPALFLTGELDMVRSFMPAAAMEGWVTDLRREVIVPDAGHWVQQQSPGLSTPPCSSSSPKSEARRRAGRDSHPIPRSVSPCS